MLTQITGCSSKYFQIFIYPRQKQNKYFKALNIQGLNKGVRDRLENPKRMIINNN